MSAAAQRRISLQRPARARTAEGAARSGSDAAEVIDASFRLPRRELAALKRIAAMRNVSSTQALRQALAILAFLVDLPSGSRLFVRDPAGRQREVVFHNF